MMTLLAVLAALQTPGAESDKVEAALKKFGDRTYRVIEDGAEVGTFALKTRIEKANGAAHAVFEGRVAYKAGDTESVLNITETAVLPTLRMVAARRKADTPGEDFEQTVTIKDGKALLKGADDSTIPIGPKTVGELAILRLVCAHEQKKDAEFRADVLSLLMPGHEPGHAFRCLGKEQIEVGGKKVDAFKWEEKGEWKHTFKIGGEDRDHTSKVENLYWVSPDGYLLRFTSGRSEMILDSK